MNLQSTFHRILTTPPKTIAKKAFDKFVLRYKLLRERSFDQENGTFTPKPSWLTGLPYRYYSLPSMDSLEVYSDVLLDLKANYMEHRFNFLGSGWVEVGHEMTASGLEGNVLNAEVKNYIEEDWIKQKVINTNRGYVKNILELIDSDYKLIDWQRDFISGYRWDELTWYRDIRYGHIKGADIKVPWEIGRMQHLPQLALISCFCRKDDPGESERIFREFRNEVLDFISANPPRFGTQWMNSMDVGIRAANWLIAYDFFRDSGIEIDTEFEKIFMMSIHDHGLHILWNLEWSSGMRANHYLANIAGLSFISAYLPVSRETTLWLAFAIQEFINELFHQFQDDGSNFEASTHYHGFSAEIVLHTFALINALPVEKIKALKNYKLTQWNYGKRVKSAKRQKFSIDLDANKVIFEDDVYKQLEKINTFTKSIVKSSGQIPQIGDNDSGRFFAFPHSHSEASGGRVSSSPESGLGISAKASISVFEGMTGSPDSDHGYKLDYEIVSKLVKKPVDISISDPGHLRTKGIGPTILDRKSIIHKSFNDFGLYTYKTSKYDIYIRCGRIGQNGKGGHSHNDQLSFELCSSGIDFIVDPGTYLYTPLPKERNKYRSTSMHNTLFIEGMEQNHWLENTKDDLFWMLGDRTFAKVLADEKNMFAGMHKAYKDKHTRLFTFGKDYIEVVDRCANTGKKCLALHLAPGIEIVTNQDNSEVSLINNDNKMMLQADGMKFEIDDYYYSPAYGVKTEAKKLLLLDIPEELSWRISFF